jgi:hypothetical protein
VTRDHCLAPWWQFAFHDVQVSSTNAARPDTKKNIAWLDLGQRNLMYFKRLFGEISWRSENSGFHVELWFLL